MSNQSISHYFTNQESIERYLARVQEIEKSRKDKMILQIIDRHCYFFGQFNLKKFHMMKLNKYRPSPVFFYGLKIYDYNIWNYSSDYNIQRKIVEVIYLIEILNMRRAGKKTGTIAKKFRTTERIARKLINKARWLHDLPPLAKPRKAS